jgi:hypothetical protein
MVVKNSGDCNPALAELILDQQGVYCATLEILRYRGSSNMSMNLALQKGKIVNFDVVFQTPTTVTKAALNSGNPTQFYRDWLLENSFEGKGGAQYKEHLATIDAMIADGYRWIMI